MVRSEESMSNKALCFIAVLLLTLSSFAYGQLPENLVAKNVPPIPQDLADEIRPYLEFRTAGLSDWHPTRREMVIGTRFGDTAQLHVVSMPGGARRQITFFPDRVGGASYQPKHGNYLLFTKDVGGGEFFQIYRYDLANGRVTLLTDGKSRNQPNRWSNDGKWFAYTSTRRTGRDSDVWIVDPADPATNRMVLQLQGGGWGVADFSPDDTKMLVGQYISANESFIHLADLKSGEMTLITPKSDPAVLYAGARFSRNGKTIYVTTDAGSEFRQLVEIELATGKRTPLTPHIEWDVESFELSPDGKTIAFTANENGMSVLHLLDTASRREIAAPKLPAGSVSGLEWHRSGKELGFNISSAKAPADAYSVTLANGRVERWTFSETGGLDTAQNVEPQLVTLESFDGLGISAFVYRPDPKKFAGPRPVVINIHGGPEAQFRPGFLGRNNYLINELGIAIVFPNVRGSSGYGKTFLTLDNGFRREDSVKDIGTVIDWIVSDPGLDGERIAVTGGSYGGYMTLASMTHYSDRLRAGIDIVGISNFVTFLTNTQDYRRDLRRVEYGDERDEEMRAFLHRISPLTNASKIRKPLFVIQGFNDPRVPYTEAEQIVRSVEENGVPTWYLMAKDEGHGFAKKQNADFQFAATLLFLREHLLAN
jgi:dipeptidyl aminopeptidase/acylaminoacyl peptidase